MVLLGRKDFGKKTNDEYDGDKDINYFILLGRKGMTSTMLKRKDFSSCFCEENE